MILMAFSSLEIAVIIFLDILKCGRICDTMWSVDSLHIDHIKFLHVKNKMLVQ